MSRKVLLLAATTALFACAVATGTASAATLSASSLVQFENANCGKYVVGGGPINGTAKFSRTGNKLKVVYSAKKLAKLHAYDLEIFGGPLNESCNLLATPVSFVTTSTGAGKATAEIEVPEGDIEFFVDGTDVFKEPFAPTDSDSLNVVLPKA